LQVISSLPWVDWFSPRKHLYPLCPGFYAIRDWRVIDEPSYNSLISKVVPWNMRESRMDYSPPVWELISLPAPYIGGIMWKTLGPKAPFIVPLVASLLVTPLLWFKLEQVSKDTDL